MWTWSLSGCFRSGLWHFIYSFLSWPPGWHLSWCSGEGTPTSGVGIVLRGSSRGSPSTTQTRPKPASWHRILLVPVHRRGGPGKNLWVWPVGRAAWCQRRFCRPVCSQMPPTQHLALGGDAGEESKVGAGNLCSHELLQAWGEACDSEEEVPEPTVGRDGHEWAGLRVPPRQKRIQET